MAFGFVGLLGEGIVFDVAVVVVGGVAGDFGVEIERWRVELCGNPRVIVRVPFAILLPPFCDLNL